MLHHVESGSGTPILFLHGYTIDHRLLLPLESTFDNRQGWRRIYVDLPSCGLSPRLGRSISADAVAAELMEFIHETIGTQQFAIVGISFGGQLARHIIAELGDQVLGTTLLAPLVKPLGHGQIPAHEVIARDEELLNSLPPEDESIFSNIAINQTAEGWQVFRDYVLPGIRNHHQGDAAELAQSFMLSQFPEARFITHHGMHLLVTGRQDHIVGWRDQQALLDSYPRMKSVVLDRAGHNVHLDQPDAVGEFVGNWLDMLDVDSSSSLLTKRNG